MNILSFDIEEWFHILDHELTRSEAQWEKFPIRIHENVNRILQLLDDCDQTATFFCLGWVAEKYPEVIRQIDDEGHEIASHSNRHQLAYTQTPEEFSEDLVRSIEIISGVTGKRIDTYRIPGFSVTAANQQWVLDSLLSAQIEVDCSIFPASRSHGGLPKFPESTPAIIEYYGMRIKEMPMNTWQFLGRRVVFSGGGYFRLFPYSLIKYLTASSDYVMTYFHPRDFDAGQPQIPGLSGLRRFKAYHGLEGCEGKLRTYIRDFDFITVREAARRIDWDSVPIVSC